MRKQNTRKAPRRSSLVTNAAADAPSLVANQHQRLTANVSTKLVRNDTMEGRKYTVVPMVMMVEGVHNGSNGPILYTAEELGKCTEHWNLKPVVVYHPDSSSACTLEEIEARKVGVIMNARLDDKKRLVAEAWLEEERIKKIDNRVWDAIQKKKTLELSTGLFTDNEMTEGEWNGEAYTAIALNHRADHLAILPDRIGACSVKDGAGFIRNEISASFQSLDEEDVELVRNQIVSFLRNQKKRSPAMNILLSNEASYEQLKEQLYSALSDKYPSSEGFAFPWIEAVYDSSFVYCMAGALFKQGFTKGIGGSSVTLSGEPVKVVRVTEYTAAPVSRIKNDAPTVPSKQKNEKGKTMNKEQLVAGLIANHGYSEEDRGMLMGLDEKTLERMSKVATTNAAAAKPTKDTPAPVTPTAAQVLNADQLAALSYGQRKLSEDRARHVATIKANPKNKLNDATLNSLPIEQLEQIAEIAAVETPTTNQGADYSGLGHVAPAAAPAATKNADEQSLPLPSYSFAK